MTEELRKLVNSIIALLVLMIVVAVLLPPFWEGIRFVNTTKDVKVVSRSCADYALSATQNVFTDDNSGIGDITKASTFTNGDANLTVEGVESTKLYENLAGTDSKPSVYCKALTTAEGDNTATNYLKSVANLIGQPLGGTIDSSYTYTEGDSYYTPLNFSMAYIDDDLLKSELKKSLVTLAQSQTTSNGIYRYVFDYDNIEVYYYQDSTFNEQTEDNKAIPTIVNYRSGTGSDSLTNLLSVYGSREDSSNPLKIFRNFYENIDDKDKAQFNRRWDLSLYVTTSNGSGIVSNTEADGLIFSAVPTYYVKIRIPWYYITKTPAYNLSESKEEMDVIRNIRQQFTSAIATDNSGYTTPNKLLGNDASGTLDAKVENWCDFWNTDPDQILISGGYLEIERTITGLT